MVESHSDGNSPVQTDVPAKTREDHVSSAALRALDEAALRHRKFLSPGVTEIGGRGGLDPVRFGDWEVGGLASDF